MSSERIDTSPSATLKHFTDSKTYVFPDLTDDKHLIIGCIDPRCECRANLRNKIQTPGGAWGVAHNRQLAHMALYGEFIGVETALLADRTERKTSVLDIHKDCAFWKYTKEINGEMADPSMFTWSAIDRWLEMYEIDGIDRTTIEELAAAATEIDYELPTGPREEDGHLINFVKDELDPEHKNVHKMEGPGKAHAYVVSHIATVVQNQKVRPNNVQAYFNSLGAEVILTSGHGNQHSPEILPYIQAGKLLIAAATMKTIVEMKDIPVIEVNRSPKGQVHFQKQILEEANA